MARPHITPVSQADQARIKALFGAFAPTAPITKPGGLPDGWTHVLQLSSRVPDFQVDSYHLVHGEGLWAFVFGPIDPAPEQSDLTEGDAAFQKVWRRGVHRPAMFARSVGELVDIMRFDASPNFWEPRWRYLLAEFVLPAFNDEDPEAFLLRLGVQAEVDLPDRCYDPTFGLPTDESLNPDA